VTAFKVSWFIKPESFGKWGMVVSEGGEGEVGTRNVAAKVIPFRNNFFSLEIV
jgi:hypothetical protein